MTESRILLITKIKDTIILGALKARKLIIDVRWPLVVLLKRKCS